MAELVISDGRAERLARGLSGEQLNWSPGPGVWSVGQCLDHLRAANVVYLPAIARALEGAAEGPVREVRLGWFSSWFIRNYVAARPVGRGKRAPAKIRPAGEVGLGVLDELLRGNQVARELVVRASAFDVNRIRFRNPFVPFLRFTVGAGLEILVQHQGRHLGQAERVRGSAGFPG